MPTPLYMELTDDTGAQIKGSVQIAGREGMVEIISMDHSLKIPTDVHTGRLTGIRMHAPLKLVKKVDSSSPLLYKAVCEGQTLKEVVVHFYEIDDTGTEVEYYRTVLEQVKVSNVQAFVPSTKDPLKEREVHQECIELVYGKISWTYISGGLEYTDAWIAAH